MNYEDFLKLKSQASIEGGFEPVFMPDMAFDFQQHLIEWSVRQGRGAIFADCGLGKSLMVLAWAKNVVLKTNKRVLILAPLAVSQQLVTEGDKFGIEVGLSRDGKPKGDITVINYERLHKADPSDYIGVVPEESSILKHWSGKTQKQVTRFVSKMPYRLLSTATPAPNDFIELGTSSEALGYLDHTEMLATFFRQISDDEKRRKATATDIVHSKRLSWRVIQSIGQYALKAHAFEPFWRWVSSWARACRKPSDLGPYDDSRFVLPPLNRFDHVVTPRQPPPGFLFTIPAFGLNQERAERRRTIEERTELVAKLVDHNEPAVVWCQLNDEGDALEKSIPDAVQVKGSQSLDEKEERLISFLRGESRVLITKAKIAGLGLNMQHCAHVVTFVDHCYDAITEILTRDSGWVTFDKVSVGDYVATINQSTLEMEWQSCSDVIWSHYEGDMIHFCGERNFDLVVTPNHNMFVRQCPIRFVNGIGWHLKRADEIDARFRRQEYRMLSCPGSWNGSSPKFVEIPVPENLRINASTKIVSKIASESLARLAAWYVSEGHARPVDSRHGGQIVICQTDKHPQNRSEIIELVRSIGLQVNCKTKDITFYSKQLATFLHDNFGHLSHRKRIPRWMKEWDSSLLEVIRDTMIRGDGCHDSLGVPRFYRTTSRELADDFQEICLKTGLRASVRERGMTNSIDGRPVFDVSIAWQNTMPSVHKSPVRRPYDGMIGCVTVPNGVVIVRRNGIPVVSGNSFEKFYQSVRRCWRFGQTKPVRLDVISTEGEVNVRTNMERKERQAEQMFESIVQFMNQSQHVESRTPSQKAEVPEWMSSRA